MISTLRYIHRFYLFEFGLTFYGIVLIIVLVMATSYCLETALQPPIDSTSGQKVDSGRPSPRLSELDEDLEVGTYQLCGFPD
jgi:hypothetical protein